MRIIKLVFASVVALLLLMMVVSWITQPPSSGGDGTSGETPKGSSPPRRTDGRYIAKKDCWAAVSEAKLKQFNRLASDKDYVAMQKMEDDRHVLLIRPGEEVFDAGSGFSAGR